MRPFRFELEAVRALSEHAEASSRAELAGELVLGLERDRALIEADSLLRQAQTYATLDDGVVVGTWDILAADAYLQRRESARVAAAEELLLQQRRIEIKRNLLVEAARRRKALEQLKARREAAHRAELERIEHAQLNEVALLLHDRRLREAAQ